MPSKAEADEWQKSSAECFSCGCVHAPTKLNSPAVEGVDIKESCGVVKPGHLYVHPYGSRKTKSSRVQKRMLLMPW